MKRLAPKLGAKVVIEPEWGYAAQIIYKNGVVRSMRHFALDLNHIGSADIAKDKGYSKLFIKKRGFPVAPGTTVVNEGWGKIIKSKKRISYALRVAKRIKYPVIVKPNSKSQGADVHLAWNAAETKNALKKIFKDEKVAILEKYLPGRDYRIVVLDKDIISAYERIPLFVTGDGVHSILYLLKKKQKRFLKEGRDTKINFKDPRIKLKLKHQKLSLGSVLTKGKQVFLLDNANLSTGGESIDVTKKISPGYKKIAVNLTYQMGLRLAGVDIMTVRGDITNKPDKKSYYIIEINAAPGLDHYVTTGEEQRKIVENMYFKVLKALGKKD